MLTGNESPDMKAPLPDILGDYELRFRTMSEKTCLGQFQVSAGTESRVLSVNHVLTAMLGYDSPEQIAGRLTSDLFILQSDFLDLQEKIQENGSVCGREVRLRQKDGAEIWVMIQAWYLKSSSSCIIEGFAEDMTEIRVLEQEMQYHETELNRYAHALTQANRKLNLLSSITRHDILNKLTGLKGYVELMKMDFSDPRIQEYLGIQAGILDSITQYTMFTKDYQEIGISTPQWFDVKTTFETAAASLPLEGIPVVIETGNLWVYADPMLERVFYNLFENSLRHAGNLSRITISLENVEGFARIIYADDGQGVPQEYKEAIFNRQYFKHTGFDLYLSREILEITGLSIRETGVPGNCARFEITVPEKFFHIGDIP